MPVLPPRGEDQKTKPVTITLPRWLSDRVDQLADVLGYRGRSELITRVLEGAMPELEQMAEKAEGGEKATEKSGVTEDSARRTAAMVLARQASKKLTEKAEGGETKGKKP